MKNIIFKKQKSNTIEFLKWIAIFTMIIDHLGILIFKESYFLRDIGRLSFPLFGYILIHNYLFFTSNKIKYIKRLWLFALISQPVFYLVISEEKGNIFFVFSLILTIIYLFEKINNMDRNKIEKFITMIITILFMIPFSYFMDYGPIGFIFLFSLYLSFINIYYFPLLFLSLFFLNIPRDRLFGFLIFPLIWIINKSELKIKRVNKWLFYLFYPIHLLILWSITFII